MKILENQTFVVTGGNSGIGYATAAELIDKGARVIITGRNVQSLEQAAAALGAETIVTDQSEMAQIEKFAAEVSSRFGQIDGMFLNAGVATFNSVEAFEESSFDEIMRVNVKGVYFTIQKFIPLLKEASSLVINASVNATLGAPGSSVYGMSKGALLTLTRILAAELSPRKIRVNAISPGPVATPLYGKLGMDDQTLTGLANTLSKKILLARFAEPKEIANLVRFLLSDESSFINGAEQVIDGGLLVNSLS